MWLGGKGGDEAVLAGGEGYGSAATGTCALLRGGAYWGRRAEAFCTVNVLPLYVGRGEAWAFSLR